MCFLRRPQKMTKSSPSIWQLLHRGWCIKFATHKWPLQLTKVHFMTIFSRFFANYSDIFHKIEVQTVILKCWTGLNLNWLKRYDTSHKYFHFNPSRKFDAPPYNIKLPVKISSIFVAFLENMNFTCNSSKNSGSSGIQLGSAV